MDTEVFLCRPRPDWGYPLGPDLTCTRTIVLVADMTMNILPSFAEIAVVIYSTNLQASIAWVRRFSTDTRFDD